MAKSRFAAAATALLLVPAAFSALLISTDAQARESTDCEAAAQVAVLPAPMAPWKGAPLRVIFAAEKPINGELALIAPDGSVAAKSSDRQGGPPYFWLAEVAAPAAGTWHATLTRADGSGACGTITRDIPVADREPPKPHGVGGSVWPVRSEWNRATENLYSAWIQKLFDSPLDAPPSWAALHEVLRDRSRNVLFDYLGLREDQMGMIIRPDCADLPYFLRAYFAFKMGLPFGYSKCSRGGAGKAPTCPAWFNIHNQEPPKPTPSTQASFAPAPLQFAANSAFDLPPEATTARPSRPVPSSTNMTASFGHYLSVVGDGVHSGSGRTALNDNNTDYYPVALTQDTLRPGTIYADPYGHVLMLIRRVPQTAEGAGVFLAVDGQPDGTVAVKRFWRGNFLFAQDPNVGGPGFKRFRPIVREANGAMRRLTNAEIGKSADYGDFSNEQAALSVEAFYDRMDEVMSPAPLDPQRALEAVITALDEQVKTRVTSVENGRKFQSSGKGDAQMPDGPSIFETTGAWEDFATPSRDLRLLIAIDVVRNFPDRVARQPGRYAMPAGKSAADVKADLDAVLAKEMATREFSYLRSDGSTWTLALKDVLDRAPALEMAYNVNDCVELRWGASQGSDEAATCKRHAPAAQRTKMGTYRAWFHDRRRPTRGV